MKDIVIREGKKCFIQLPDDEEMVEFETVREASAFEKGAYRIAKYAIYLKPGQYAYVDFNTTLESKVCGLYSLLIRDAIRVDSLTITGRYANMMVKHDKEAPVGSEALRVTLPVPRPRETE